MENKHFVIGGAILLAVIFVAGLVFGPSGFISVGQPTMQYACVQLNTGDVRCVGDGSGYWIDTEFQNNHDCELATDDSGTRCIYYGDCSCKRIEELG
jgi:hypothetical protein